MTDFPCCDSVAYLPGAIAAAEQVAYEAVNAENRALRQMVTDLQTRFEASQLLADHSIAALNRANDALEKQQADLETARHERDHAVGELMRLSRIERLTDTTGCTCTIVTLQDYWSPAEWEQSPWCPVHPDMGAITAEVEHMRGELTQAISERDVARAVNNA